MLFGEKSLMSTLNLVAEPGSRSSEQESALLKELEAKKRAANKAVKQRKKAEHTVLTHLERKEVLTCKKELRELQKSELSKTVIDHRHNGVWDTLADKRNDDSLGGVMSAAERARAKAQKEIDRKIQQEREENEKQQIAWDEKQRKKAERAEAAKREKVRLQQAADRKAEKEEKRRVKAEMEVAYALPLAKNRGSTCLDMGVLIGSSSE